MRETLTAFAIFLIVALTGLLAGPYCVDWNASRGFLEARLSRALGQKVTVGGSIDLKLLPTPYLVLNQAVVGSDDGPLSLGIRHLDLELSIAPLLHGEFEIVEAKLAEPTIRITLQRDRTLPPLPVAPAFAADVRFDRITITDGTLALADPDSGRTLALEHVDLQAEAESLGGPFRASGEAGEAGARTRFRFVSAAAQGGRARIKLGVDGTPSHASLDVDGNLSLVGTADALVRPSFEGTIAAAGHVDSAGFDVVPWRLSGPVRGDLHEARLEAGTLRLGGETAAMTLAAAGQASFGQTGALHLDLSAKQLDLDRWAARGSVADAPARAIPTLADLLALRRTLQPALPTSLGLSVAAATYGGAALENLEATFSVGVADSSPFRLALDLPGNAHAAVDGTAAFSAFTGHVAIDAPNLPATRAWLALVGADFASSAVPFRSIEGRAEVAYGNEGVDLHGVVLRLDQSTMTGDAHLTPASATRPAAVKADLHAAALDLQAMPDLEALRSATALSDLDLRFEARGLKVARFGSGALDAGHLRFALRKTGGRFTLDGFAIEGLGGASVGATASLDPSGGRVDATLEAGRLVDLAALLRRVVPGAWSDALASRAPVLAPANLTLAAAWAAGDKLGDVVPRRLSVAGALGATKLNVALTPDPGDDRKVLATAAAEAPEASILLRQLGLPTLLVPALGPGRLALEAKGPLSGSLAATARASIGRSTLDLAGRLALGDGGSASGTLRALSPDASLLLQSLAMAFPDLVGRLSIDLAGAWSKTATGLTVDDLKGQAGARVLAGAVAWHGRDAKGDVALTGSLSLDRLSLPTMLSLALGPPQQPAAGADWSAATFGSGLIDLPPVALDLQVQTLDMGRGLIGSDARFGLGLSPGSVALRGLKARVQDGTVGADLVVRRDGATAAIEGGISASGVALALPGITGRLSGSLSLAGSGRSALALASSLSGTGEATLGDLQIARADPAALPKVFEDVEADRVSVDEDAILRALDDAAIAPLAAGTRPFALSLAAGTLHGDPKPGTSGDGAVRSTATFAVDLRTRTLDARVVQTLQALPKSWSGAPPQIVLQVEGPFGAAVRTINASGFVNALAGRALARETARIEAYEADARERAFFNQRLQADRRREQERVKAEDDARLAAETARKAEADRRAREAAARLERTRKAEEAARAAQDRAAQDRATQEKAARERVEEQARERAAPQRPAPDTRPAGPSGLQVPAQGTRPQDPSTSGLY